MASALTMDNLARAQLEWLLALCNFLAAMRRADEAMAELAAEPG